MRVLSAVGGVALVLLLCVLLFAPLAFAVAVPSYLGPKDVAIGPGAGPVVVDWPKLAPASRLQRRFVSHYTVTVQAKTPVTVGLTDSTSVERHLAGASYEELADMAGTGEGDPTQPVWKQHSGHTYEPAPPDPWSWSARDAGTSASLTIPPTSPMNRVVVLADGQGTQGGSATLSVRATLRGGGWLTWPLVALYGWGGSVLVLLVLFAGRNPGRPERPTRRMLWL